MGIGGNVRVGWDKNTRFLVWIPGNPCLLGHRINNHGLSPDEYSLDIRDIIPGTVIRKRIPVVLPFNHVFLSAFFLFLIWKGNDDLPDFVESDIGLGGIVQDAFPQKIREQHFVFRLQVFGGERLNVVPVPMVVKNRNDAQQGLGVFLVNYFDIGRINVRHKFVIGFVFKVLHVYSRIGLSDPEVDGEAF